MPSLSMAVLMLWACADLRYAAVSRSQGLGAGCVDLAAIPISSYGLRTCNLLLAVTREPHLSPGSWVDGRTLSPKVCLCGSQTLHAYQGPWASVCKKTDSGTAKRFQFPEWGVSAGMGASSNIFETIHRDIVLGSVLSLRISGWLDFTAKCPVSPFYHKQ